MIPIDLQDYLKDKLTELLAGYNLTNPNGEFVNINVYAQNLPAKQGKKDTDHFPYIIVGLEDGENTVADDNDTATISLLIGTFDEQSDYQGYRDAVNIANKILAFFNESIQFDGKHTLNYPIRYLFTDENTFPYNFLALQTNWEVPRITMKDDFLT